MSQSDLVELVHDLRLQLSLRGAGAFRTLEVAFELNDRDGTTLFDFQEVEAILAKAGLFLKRQSLTKLYRFFDRHQNERVSYVELLDAIRGSLSPRRLNILHQVFDALDSTQHGAVDVEQVLRSFDPTRHPHVLSGQKKAADVLREMQVAFDGAGASNNGAVTRDEFLRVYAGIGATVPDDDDFFVALVERCWGVKEHIPASLLSTVLNPSSSPAATARLTLAADGSPSRTPLLDRVRGVLREKVRQRAGATQNESDALRAVFKHFDLSNTTLIPFSVFRATLERIGVQLDPSSMQALFDEFAEGEVAGQVVMDYLRFVTTLYEEESSAPAAHAFRRSQAWKASTAAAQSLASSMRPREVLDTGRVLLSAPAREGEGVAAAAAADARVGVPKDFSSSSASLGATLPLLAKRAGVRRTAAQAERESSMQPTVVFLLGGPGVGCSTVAARLAREFAFVSLDLSALHRAEALNTRSGASGAQIRAALSVGDAVPAEVSLALLSRAIRDGVAQGQLYYVVEGFPRSLVERDAWSRAMGSTTETPFALYLEATQPVLELRLAHRAKVTGQALDQRAVQRSFDRFARDTVDVLNAFGREGRLHVVDAAGTPDEVYKQVRTIIAEL